MLLGAVSTGYPFLDAFLTILIVFAWVLYLWIAVMVLTDVFRRRDLSGWAKVGWTIAVVVLEWFGALIYLIANHDGMAERRAQDERAAQAQLDAYIRSTAATGSAASEIQRAHALLDGGAITQPEFEQLKAKTLAGERTAAPDATRV